MDSTSDPFRGLKSFQQRTAAHVDRMLFEEGRSRFLVADEVGLGKTLVARGVVGCALQRLRAAGTKRVDVVYISSNAEIGRQNVRRLVPEGYEVFDRLDRLTLLPLHVHDLQGKDRPNFIAFTPGTLPDAGGRTGTSRERALIYVYLERAWNLRGSRGPMRLLMHPVHIESNFVEEIAGVRARQPDEEIGREFVRRVVADGLRDEFLRLASEVPYGSAPSSDQRDRRLRLVARLRLLLARSCVAALEPDVVILDEFQRFRHLLEDDTEAAELFQMICEHQDTTTGQQTKVLLLSATPYRMYTGRDESEDHHQDFVKTLHFLLDRDDAETAHLANLLAEYRRQIYVATEAAPLLRARDALAERLRTVMVRTERLAVKSDRNGMLDPNPRRACALATEDVTSFVHLDAVFRDAGVRGGGSGLEYWKSAPYLPNFMDGYQVKAQLKAAATEGPLAGTIARRWQSGAGLLRFDAVRRYQPVPATNARLRGLEQDILDRGMWRLLWLPPTFPYYALGSPFAECAGVTKRLLFSSWRVSPRAIAALMSYEAERRMVRLDDRYIPNTLESRQRLDRRLLDFRVSTTQGDRRAAMPVFAMIYPSVALAEIDPLELRREWQHAGRGMPSLDEARDWARSRVEALLNRLPQPEGPTDARWYWAAPLLLDGERGRDWLGRAGLTGRWAESGGEAWVEHLRLAHDTASGRLDPELGRRPDDLSEMLADLALGAPGVACLRALGRVLGRATRTDDAVREAAARAAWGVRVLLNHPESISVIRARRPDPYWRLSLRYCVDGGLQAVLDEFAHLIFDLGNVQRLERGDQPAAVADVIHRVTSARASRVIPDEITVSTGHVAFVAHRMRVRFAREYGQDHVDDGEEVTTTATLREAFNSPFAPFVLASTSVGQEGLDFHPYCHAVVHWNLPSNPVDLEQREGRVHRYKGHALRKNVAEAVGARSLGRGADDPWEAIFADAETTEPAIADPDIVPYWVFPGTSRIERHVPILPLSRDEERLHRLQQSLALYRAAIGQPRQEELVELLSGGRLPDGVTFEDLRIDLRPR